MERVLFHLWDKMIRLFTKLWHYFFPFLVHSKGPAIRPGSSYVIDMHFFFLYSSLALFFLYLWHTLRLYYFYYYTEKRNNLLFIFTVSSPMPIWKIWFRMQKDVPLQKRWNLQSCWRFLLMSRWLGRVRLVFYLFIFIIIFWGRREKNIKTCLFTYHISYLFTSSFFQTAVKGVARILQHMDRIVHSFVRVTGTIQSCKIHTVVFSLYMH